MKQVTQSKNSNAESNWSDRNNRIEVKEAIEDDHVFKETTKEVHQVDKFSINSKFNRIQAPNRWVTLTH